VVTVSGQSTNYRPRIADAELDLLVKHLPGVMLVGPRGCGKTTTASQRAESQARLDIPTVAEAFRANPDAAMAGLATPLLIDEWQLVPESLGAVKRAVDSGASAGSILVTGSVRSSVDGEHWPGTGRLTRVRIYPFTEREKRGFGAAPGLIDRVFSGTLDVAGQADLEVRDYVEIALAGGYPDAMAIGKPEAARRWYSSYIDDTVSRDVRGLSGSVTRPRDPRRMRTWLEAIAINSAGAPSAASLWRAAGINQRTAEAYDSLLEDLFITERLPAWSTNRLKRLTRSPKRYVIDTGVWGALLGTSATAMRLDGNLTGRLLETFVAAQVRPEVTAAGGRLSHLRTADNRREVDLVIELPSRGIVAIEVKAAAGPRRDSAKHLAWLRDQLGDEFIAGFVLHTGPFTYEIGERLLAAPIAALWSEQGGPPRASL
jgi:predicted AAA+ superfamily ATPase